MKMFISVSLAALMIFAISIPSLAVGYDEHPTIYVTGARVNHIYAADGSLLFPETSYFIKNMYHDTFPAPINNLAIDLMNHDATVSGGEYAQYTLYDGSNELKIISGQDENDTVEKEPFYMIFIRFFTTFIEFLKKLIGNNG